MKINKTMSLSEFESLREKYEKLKQNFDILTRITENMVSTLELEELLQTLLTRLIEVIKADGGAIAILEDGELLIKTVAGIKQLQGYSCKQRCRRLN
ncbi:hypothetical protein [Candidatus Kryptobacter tengchongensis]|nr:hypothetical protein [Candidatus Kryptobacter tengchongensis]